MCKSLLVALCLIPAALLAASAPQGCLIETVQPGSSAEAAGLKHGDQIVEANGKALNTIEDLQMAVRGSGADLALGVKRGDKTEAITAKIKPALRQQLGVQCVAPPQPRTRIAVGDQRSLSLSMGAALPQTTLDATPFGAGDERIGSAGFIGGARFLNDISPRMDVGIDFNYTRLGNHTFDVSGTISGPTELTMRSAVLMGVIKFHAPQPSRVRPYALVGVGVNYSTLRWIYDRPAGAYSPTDSTSLVDDSHVSFAAAVGGGVDVDLTQRYFAGFEGRLQYTGPSRYQSGPLGHAIGIDHFSGSQANFNFIVHLGMKFGSPPQTPLQLP